MIGDYAEGNSLFAVAAVIRLSSYLFRCRYRSGKNIGVIVALLTCWITRTSLSKPIPVSTCFSRQWNQAAIFQAVELHEHIVPDFDHLRMVLVDE